MNKLNEDKVKEIRALYNSGYYTQEQLSIEYKVSQYLISRIVNNKSWI